MKSAPWRKRTGPPRVRVGGCFLNFNRRQRSSAPPSLIRTAYRLATPLFNAVPIRGFDAAEGSLRKEGFYPHPDCLIETEDGPQLLIPSTLPKWSEPSYTRFLDGDLPPSTLRDHFNATRSFLAEYAWLPDPVHLDLVATLAFASFLVTVFPAIPIIEVRGPVGSGKSTLLHVLSHICRSGIFTSNSTIAGLARARHLDPCPIFLDEPLRNPNHPVVLGSYKRGSTRLIAGPQQGLISQRLYGLTFKVPDGASEALKDRTITIDTAPAEHPLPPFLPEREQERISRLTDNAL